eukprot:GHVU01067353.1.p1 GENE.GHVU01067353.1~~GHVU01067353.1.p1  ORF type:complete len:324 (-),score=47.87 GHVU01067353.1:167-1138(-)
MPRKQHCMEADECLRPTRQAVGIYEPPPRPVKFAGFLLPLEEIADSLCQRAENKQRNDRWDIYLAHMFFGGYWISCGSHVSIVFAGACTSLDPGLRVMMMELLFIYPLLPGVSWGNDIFTSSVHHMTVAAMRRRVKWWLPFVHWSLTWCMNFLAALFVAFFLSFLSGGLSDMPEIEQFARDTATAKLNKTWYNNLFRGVMSGMMVTGCNVVMTGTIDVGGKIFTYMLSVIAMGMGKMELVECGMYYVPVGMMVGAKIDLAAYLWKYLLVVTMGNMLGAGIIVGMPVYWFSNPGLTRIELEQRRAASKNFRSAPTTEEPLESIP